MKDFRAKVIVSNPSYYVDPNTRKHYPKYHFERIENYYFNKRDKEMNWNIIKNSYPGLKKLIWIFKRSNPITKVYNGKEIVNYTEELIYKN